MRVRPRTHDLDEEQRLHIARYWDAVNGAPWGEDWEDNKEVQRYANYDECWQYLDNLLTGYLDDYALREAADMAEGAM